MVILQFFLALRTFQWEMREEKKPPFRTIVIIPILKVVEFAEKLLFYDILQYF